MEDPHVICVGQALSSQPGKSNHASAKALPGLGHTSPNRVWKQPRASWALGSVPLKPWYIYIAGWCGIFVPLAFSSAKPRDSGLDFTMAIEALGHLPHTRTSCKSTPCHSCLQGVPQDSSMVLYPPSLPSSLSILGTCQSVLL